AVAGVGGDSVDRSLVAVERDGERAFALQPEVAVEPLAQDVGLLPAVARRVTVAEVLGQVGPTDVGGVEVALHLSERDRWVGEAPIGEADAVPRVLPALVDQPVATAALVLEVAVTVT